MIVNSALVKTFQETNARNILFFTAVLTAFAAVIAVGVVYNSARIQLAERSWELASLRVLGFTRREVSVLRLAELAVEVAVALPVGLLAGYGLSAFLISLMPHDVLEFPLPHPAAHLSLRRRHRPRGGRGERAHRPQPHRPARPGRRPEDPRMKKTAAIAWGIGAAAVVALGAWILQPQPLPVEAAEVKRGSFELAVSDDGRTRVRDRYTISAPLAGRVEPAAFTKISALGVEEQRVNVVLDFLDPLDRLATIGDGFRVDAHIITRREEDAVKVPVGALFRAGEGGWAVFVAEGGRAVRRAVKVAMRNSLEAAVEAGVKPGDRVIVYPPDSLRDGSRVEVR